MVEKIIPERLAPNAITMIAFACAITGHAILYFDTDTFEYPHYQPYSLILFGLLVMTYHFLDGCDGKQARKINNCSPLGTILDHGLDSITITLIFLPQAQIFGL